MSERTDTFYEDMTAKVIDLLENATENWDKPWATLFGTAGLPTNAKTKNAYKGGNAFWFWVIQASEGYSTSLWGTYKQFQALGGQIRKGEKGTTGIKWVVTVRCEKHGKSQRTCCNQSKRSMFPTTFTVFNYDQQDGFEVETVDLPDGVTSDETIEAFLAATGANIEHREQDRAYYTPGTNDIVLPLKEAFESTHGYYATALHEVTHWTGDESRLGREQKNAFGSERYAAEELVAELGSIFLQAEFGLAPEPSANSASYIKGWLKALKADPKNLFKAASLAGKATTFLLEKAHESEVEEVPAAA